MHISCVFLRDDTLYMYICIYVYIYMYVHVYVFTCVCIFIYVFIFTMRTSTQHVELRFQEHAYAHTSYTLACRTQILQRQRESWGDGAIVWGAAHGCEGQGLFAG